ncbi:MAG TPA: hypothetical protein VOA41_09755 [Candidatus Dormibacteraeota bacterium]|nr:hypothetical protein [Candidatus Dormibacteraeota bacterium]
METSTQLPVVTKYRIEVSGWDENEAFFVEKTDLEWSGRENKRVRLRHLLRDAAVIFVRLLQTSTQAHVCPVAYQVRGSSGSNDSRPYEYSLIQLHPRGSF